MSRNLQRRLKQAGTMMQRNFDHMDPKLPNLAGTKRIPGELERQPKWIPPKDRVKQFNITVGDRVLVTTGDKAIKNKIGTVAQMDRTRNVVYLKEPYFRRAWRQVFGRKGMFFDPDHKAPDSNSRPRPIHYSNLKLVVSEASADRVAVATRLRATKPSWSLTRNAFTWSRIPEAVREYNVKSDGSVRAARKEVWELDEESDLSKRHERVPWPLENMSPQDRADALGRSPLAPSESETAGAALQRESFQPTLQPFRRNIPELQVPHKEFGGDRNSSAKRTARWNARNRDPVTGKIVVARRPVVTRRFARIQWDRPSKATVNGQPAKKQQQQQVEIVSEASPVLA